MKYDIDQRNLTLADWNNQVKKREARVKSLMQVQTNLLAILSSLKALKCLQIGGHNLPRQALEQFFSRSEIVLEEVILHCLNADQAAALRHYKGFVALGLPGQVKGCLQL